MPGKTDKRKKAVDSGDEIQPGRQNKFRRTGYVTSSAIPEFEFQGPSWSFVSITALTAKNGR